MRELLFIIGLFVLFSCQRHTNGKIGGNSTTEETKVVAEIIQSTCPDEKHPHMIDLGLPSGTKWSCCNTDALSPEDSGGYYAWGETKEKDIYDDTSYLYSEGEILMTTDGMTVTYSGRISAPTSAEQNMMWLA